MEVHDQIEQTDLGFMIWESLLRHQRDPKPLAKLGEVAGVDHSAAIEIKDRTRHTENSPEHGEVSAID